MLGERAASQDSWWQLSGVDTLVGEEPVNWLVDEKPRPRRAEAPAALSPPAPAPAAEPELPRFDDLAGFHQWLATTLDLPFAAASARRASPVGNPASGLMVLIDMPSQGDLASGSLLGGEAGDLFDRMMGAIGKDRSSLYLAPLSPFRSPDGRLGQEAAYLAKVARLHAALAAPKALLVFGDSCAKALFGQPVAAARGRWLELETPAATIRTLVTIRPEKLLVQPALKKLAWNDLQMLAEALK